jgi:beta-phosphoglucomutase-like phosphatase (HAD superfamily)
VFPATLFDYNGVLADDEHVHLEAFREALSPLGVGVAERDYFERYLGFDDRGAFRAMLADAGRPHGDAHVEELVRAKKPLYRQRALAHLPTFAGAAALVSRRARSGPVLVVSGALRDEIELGLSVLGVAPLVAHVVSAEDTRAGKPDPEGYVRAVEYLLPLLGEERARRALVIEDSISGVEAARAAALPCVAVTHTYGADALRAAGAHAVVATLADLTDDLFERLYRELYR